MTNDSKQGGYTAQVKRDGKFWAIYVPEIDYFTQARDVREARNHGAGPDRNRDWPAFGLVRTDRAAMTEPRTVTVTGWLARHQVRQHLKLHGIDCREERGDRESTFHFRATEAEWDGIQQAKQEAER